MLDYLSQFWAWLSAYSETGAWIVAICTGLTIVITLIEKAADKEFIGRRIFRLIGRVLMFFVNWFLTPFKPTITAFRQFINHSERLEKRFIEITAHDQQREEKRDLQFNELKDSFGDLAGSISTITREVTLNGGKSMKDAVNRLVKHDAEKWDVLQELREFVRLTSLRLDIADEADKRMTFRLSPAGECTAISPMFLRFFGYTEKDLLGTDWDFCIGKQSIDDVHAKWDKAIKKRQHYRNDQFIVDSDGQEHYCRVEGHPMIVDNELIYFHGTVVVLDADVPKG